MPSSNPSTTPPPTSRPSELKLGQPKPFSGDRATTTTFILACRNYFNLNDDLYSNDKRKVGFALSFMNDGIAAPWAAAFIKEAMGNSPPSYGTWDEFVKKLEEAFSPISSSADAVTKLKTLRQGAGTADEYVSKFRNIVGLTDLTDMAFLVDKFLEGLNTGLVQKVLSSTDKMKTMDDYYAVASRLDAQYQYANTFSSRRTTNNRRNIRQVTTPAEANSSIQALQKLSNAERDILRKEGKCFRCRKQGHMSRECPTNRTQRRVRQMELVAEEAADEDINVGRIVAMMSKLPANSRETLTKRMVDEGF